MAKKNKKIVVIGGGTGVYTVLSALKPYFNDLTAVVTMADDGGSAGILREEFGILPPGDVRRALIALSSSNNEVLSQLFAYRFQEGVGLSGHSFGNLMLTALERLTGDFESAIQEAGKILQASGKVVPVTLGRSKLIAELEDGSVIRGESNIDIPSHDANLRIKKIWLEPAVVLNANARKELLAANAIILGPGDLYTSLIPNLLVKGMREVLGKTKAKVVYFTNVMTKFGETNNFRASDFVETLLKYLGPKTLDFVFINKIKPSPKRLATYIKQRSDFVDPNLEDFKKLKVMPIEFDLIRSRGFIRHDPAKVARAIKMIL